MEDKQATLIKKMQKKWDIKLLFIVRSQATVFEVLWTKVKKSLPIKIGNAHLYHT